MMKTKQKTSTPAKPLARRMIACFLTALGLWLLLLGSSDGTGGGLMARIGSSQGFVTAALAAQLGSPSEPPQSTSPTWPRLLLGESGLLSGYTKSASPSDAEDETEDAKEPPLDHRTQTQVVEKFFKASDTEGYAKADDIYILNKTQKQLDLTAIAGLTPGVSLKAGEGPQILIMHTHGSEAYSPEGGDVYEASGVARTTDLHYNTIRVGDEIGRIFTEMGLSVVHDQTLYDYPNYNGAYERSRDGIAWYLQEYPTIQIVLDVHRDALIGQDGTVYKAVTEVDGEKTAQILLVMGTDEGGAAHPNWQQNLSLSMRLQHRMNTLWPGLARPITLRSSRFNQEMTPGSVLVEVGSHGNTLQEALAGARLFARSAGQVFLELQE